MKIIFIILRSLMGLLFVAGSLAYFFNAIPPMELTGSVKLFMDGMIASGYLMQLIKLTELVCGVAFLTGYCVPLALVVIAPVVVNIVLFQIFLDPSGLPIGIFLVLVCLLLARVHWAQFKPLLSLK